MFVKALRVGLGQLIIFVDFLTRPGKKQRPAAAQAQVDAAAKDLTLYPVSYTHLTLPTIYSV